MRSEALKVNVNAKETLSSAIWSYRSNKTIDSNKEPAPCFKAAVRSAAVVFAFTTSATSCTTAGKFQIAGAFVTPAAGNSLKITAKAQLRSGKFKAAITLGCNSPA